MKKLYFSSFTEGTDLRVAVPVCTIALVLYLTELCGIVEELTKKVIVAGVPILYILDVILVAFGSILLIEFLLKKIPNIFKNIPDFILIFASIVTLILEIIFLNKLYVFFPLTALIFLLLSCEENFNNPPIIINILVSSVRLANTILILVVIISLIKESLK